MWDYVPISEFDVNSIFFVEKDVRKFNRHTQRKKGGQRKKKRQTKQVGVLNRMERSIEKLMVTITRKTEVCSH